MAVNTGPSFLGRLGRNVSRGLRNANYSGMTNALAQNYGAPGLRGAARATSGFQRRSRNLPSTPTNPRDTMQPYPSGGMMGNLNNGMMSGIMSDMGGRLPFNNTPQLGNFNFGNMGGGLSVGPSVPPIIGGSGGIAGVSGENTPYMPMENSGFWNTYNRLLGGSNPSGRMVY